MNLLSFSRIMNYKPSIFSFCSTTTTRKSINTSLSLSSKRVKRRPRRIESVKQSTRSEDVSNR